MKNITRWSLGFISTCFLAVGLVRAADRFDPVNRELNTISKQVVSTPTPDCVALCNIAEAPTPDCVALCNIVE